MDIREIMYDALSTECPLIHNNRLNAVLDVAEGLRNSKNMTLSAIGRHLVGNTRLKHKIKKVDRCLGNKQLHSELGELYKGLSSFVFEYVASVKEINIVIDLCYLKDDRCIQMLSAQLCTKGRALPMYQEVFREGELKGRVKSFMENLSKIIPKDKKVIVIMDAGFYVEWFKTIEELDWKWICRIRQGKDIKLDTIWMTIKEFVPQVSMKTAEYKEVLLTKKHEYRCRLITTRRKLKGRKQKISRNRTTSKAANGNYSSAAKEPWILATNLSAEECKAVNVVLLYSKRMQIEETFRDIKSPQFGLAGRYVRTMDIYRWATLMLLASMVIICYWVIGVIGHSQGMQRIFQPNTVKDKRIYSYFTLGKFIIEFNKLGEISYSDKLLTDIIREELKRA